MAYTFIKTPNSIFELPNGINLDDNKQVETYSEEDTTFAYKYGVPLFYIKFVNVRNEFELFGSELDEEDKDKVQEKDEFGLPLWRIKIIKPNDDEWKYYAVKYFDFEEPSEDEIVEDVIVEKVVIGDNLYLMDEEFTIYDFITHNAIGKLVDGKLVLTLSA